MPQHQLYAKHDSKWSIRSTLQLVKAAALALKPHNITVSHPHAVNRFPMSHCDEHPLNEHQVYNTNNERPVLKLQFILCPRSLSRVIYDGPAHSRHKQLLRQACVLQSYHQDNRKTYHEDRACLLGPRAYHI